jgi:nucleoside-diphosphate-sugar epimerase
VTSKVNGRTGPEPSYPRRMSRALIVGGTGLIGRAAARRLLASGWRVDVTGRDRSHLPEDLAASGARFFTVDRQAPQQLAALLDGGADLLIDCVCYTAVDALGLLPLLADVGSTVMLSSKAVYIDDAGNHPNSPVRPEFDGPVTEAQPTMAPSDIGFNSREGYGANKVAAEQVLLDSGAPVTVLRPSKVHGEGALLPREWVFVKRALDERPAVLLAHRGVGCDHPSAAVNIAALIETVAAQPGRRILNSADPDAPNGLEIARTVARRMGHEWEEIRLDDDVDASLGWHPWDSRPPIVLDMTAAEALGYVPAGDYAATVAEEIDWLASGAVHRHDAVELAPGLDADFFDGRFDYAAEDRYLAATRSGAGFEKTSAPSSSEPSRSNSRSRR